MTRQVAFACNIARPKARDTPRSGHPAPTCLPCQPSRFHLPASHQANPPSGQHSAREQERAETARQSTLTVTFTARKSPVQATPRARQPAPAARRYLFQIGLTQLAGREPHIWRVIGQNTPYMAVGMTQLGPNCVTPIKVHSICAQRYRAQPLRPSERSERGSSRLERVVRQPVGWVLLSFIGLHSGSFQSLDINNQS
jgi:hypothetical protein